MPVIDDLEARVRVILRDTSATDPRWTSAAIKVWLADGQDEVCRRAYVIEDSTTIAVCKVVMTLSQPKYTVSDKIMLIEDADLYTLAGVYDSPIEVIDKKELTYQRPGWLIETGKPTNIIVTSLNTIVVTPIPTATEVGMYIMMTVKRLPINVLSDAFPTPEVSTQFYQDMVHYACHQAYLQDDVDTQDLKQAATFLAMFESSVGPRPSAAIERVVKEQPHDLHIQVRR